MESNFILKRPAREQGTAVTSKGAYQVRALERALNILSLFSVSVPELSLSDIAEQTGIAKSTTFRLVSVLTDYGFLERIPDTERYRIGIRAFEIGSIYIQSTSVEQEARPFLARLAAECNQTANLGVLNDGQVVHIAVVPPDRVIRYYAAVGDRVDSHCTGLGKALICDFSDEQLADLAERHPLVSYTRRTITSLDILRAHLKEVQEQGYAIDDEESFIGLRCVAAPIRNDKGEIVAAISVSGPSAEFGESALPSIIDAVVLAARGVSARLGYGVVADRLDTAANVAQAPAADDFSA